MNAIAHYFRNIFQGITTTFAGMRVTMKYLRAPVITLQYPDEKMTMFERFRGLLHNRIEDCIGCGQCVRACPVDCITMVTQKVGKDEPDLGLTRDGTPKKLHVYEFDIDTLKCMWCNLCTEVCPTECLTMSAEYEVASADRDAWTLRFAIESPPDGFDLEGMRQKQNRITNPVGYRGEPDPSHKEVPEGSARPLSGVAEFDFNRFRQEESKKAATTAKPAAAATAKPAPQPATPKPAAAPAAPEAGKPAPAPAPAPAPPPEKTPPPPETPGDPPEKTE